VAPFCVFIFNLICAPQTKISQGPLGSLGNGDLEILTRLV
jgi:hypothetical protein